MEPKLVTRDSFTVLGVLERCFYDDPGFFDTLWSQHYLPFHEQIKPYSPDQGHYAVHFNVGPSKIDDVLAGMAVESVREAPDGLVLREIPGSRYALFETTLGQVSALWGSVYDGWLPSSPFAHAAGPDLEYFPPGTADSDSPVYVYIPIVEKRM